MAGALGAEYCRAMRAAVLVLTGCSLKSPDHRPGDESHAVEDTAPWGPPALQVTPDAVDFGVVDLGEHVSTTIELANVGGDDLVLDELRVAYEEPSIELDWDGGDALAAGASAPLSLTWSPRRAQDLKIELRVGSNDPVAPIVAVLLTGATATPRIDVDPTLTDFGQVPVGYSIERSIKIANVGHADLEIESVSFLPDDPDAMVMELEDFVIPALVPWGEMRSVRIRYTPDDEGENRGVLTVQSNDPDMPTIRAELEGAGVAEPDTGP